jgi:hypothetical protein
MALVYRGAVLGAAAFGALVAWVGGVSATLALLVWGVGLLLAGAECGATALAARLARQGR